MLRNVIHPENTRPRLHRFAVHAWFGGNWGRSERRKRGKRGGLHPFLTQLCQEPVPGTSRCPSAQVEMSARSSPGSNRTRIAATAAGVRRQSASIAEARWPIRPPGPERSRHKQDGHDCGDCSEGWATGLHIVSLNVCLWCLPANTVVITRDTPPNKELDPVHVRS